MHLKPYIDSLPKGGIAILARALEISTVYLFQLAAQQDGRKPSPALCVRIENVTFKAVRRWDMRPDDWHLIWPDLIGADGAPAVPTAAETAAAAAERAA